MRYKITLFKFLPRLLVTSEVKMLMKLCHPTLVIMLAWISMFMILTPGNTKAPHYWPIVRRINWWSLDSLHWLHKGTVIRKTLPCYDVIVCMSWRHLGYSEGGLSTRLRVCGRPTMEWFMWFCEGFNIQYRCFDNNYKLYKHVRNDISANGDTSI